MKTIIWLYISLILVFVLTGCSLTVPVSQPTQVEQVSTTTFILSTSTVLPTITPTKSQILHGTAELLPSPTLTPKITMIAQDTLEPEKAYETISGLLRESVDCSAPCFWGIVPGQTTSARARDILNHLSLYIVNIANEGKDYWNINYDLDSGLSMLVILQIHGDIIENISIHIAPGNQSTEIPRDWSAYSPEVLIKRYGTPSKVEFAADWGGRSLFAMYMYFASADLIVQYSGTQIIPIQKSSSQVCPLTAQFDTVWLWMGKNPRHPPGEGIPLEQATSITLDEFVELMTGDPDLACFTFLGEVFP
jgi:hypothetical protein